MSTRRLAAPDLALPDKPSIAVLAFQNMSGDPEQEYFADGMVEDIVAALTRVRSLFVISSNSSLTYKGCAFDIRQVGRELGVRYVFDGSVDKVGGRVDLTAQLTDATTDSRIWAERFEARLDDIFGLQDKVAARVLSSIAPGLGHAEIYQARRRPTEDFVTYDYFLRGKYCLDKFTKEANEEAFDHFQEASRRAPEFALPLAFAAICFLQRKTWGWSTDQIGELILAESLGRRALELDARDPRVLSNVGWVFAHIDERLEEAAVLLDQSVDLDPNSALGWSWRATVKVMLGEKSNRVIEDYEHALRLSPFDPKSFMTFNGLARAHFVAGHYDEAESWAMKALLEHPKHLFSFRCLCASLALAGRLDEARQTYERYRQLDPTARLASIRKWLRLRCDEDVKMFAKGLRLAGMPE